MTKLDWGVEDRPYTSGVDRGVLYPAAGPGVPWNGLTSVKEAPTDNGQTTAYFDGQAYLKRRTSEGFAATLEAMFYPEEFEEYDGYSDHLVAGQRRKLFGLAYRTMEDGVGGYKIHLVYNILATPASVNRETLDSNTDVQPLSWELTTTPMRVTGAKMSSHLVIDSRKAHPWTLEALENVIYGSVDFPPSLPDPNDVLELFEANAIVRVIDNGDGSFSISGPDDIVKWIDSSSWEVTWDSAVWVDTETYVISSL